MKRICQSLWTKKQRGFMKERNISTAGGHGDIFRSDSKNLNENKTVLRIFWVVAVIGLYGAVVLHIVSTTHLNFF